MSAESPPQRTRPNLAQLRDALMVVVDFIAGAARDEAAADDIMSTDTVALARIGYTRRVLEDAARSGALPAIKVARGWRIARADLAAWEARRGRRATTSPTDRRATRQSNSQHANADPDTDLVLLRASGAKPTRR